MKQIVFASSNKGKLKEVKEILAPLNIEVLSLDDISLKIEVEENGDTFFENALIKAKDIASKCYLPVISDDSGLIVESLPGLLGVHTARFMQDKTYKERCEKIIEMLESKENRRASFVCFVVYINGDLIKSFEGKTDGYIAKEYDSNGNNGFGYDPIFCSDKLGKTFASASDEEKNEVSHRGKAFNKLVKYLKENGL